jgi:hypothetical protein
MLGQLGSKLRTFVAEGAIDRCVLATAAYETSTTIDSPLQILTFDFPSSAFFFCENPFIRFG